MESPAISTGEWLEDRQMYKMHLPHVYKAFPWMLQPLDSVAPAVLRETRGRRWRERAMRIRDDALSWTQCTREWREAEEEAAREEAEEGPNPFSHSHRYARMCKDHVDWELLNLALRIYFEGDFSEKHRMPHPSEPPIVFVRWAKGEVNSGDPRRAARWECLTGLMPTSTPPEPEQVDPLPYLSPKPAED